MISPSIIQRSNRRTLSIMIDEKGELIVKAPNKMSLNEIFAFLYKKQKWIEDRQTKIKSVLSKNYDLINYQKLLLLGKHYQICLTKHLEKPYLTQEAIILNYSKNLNNLKSQIKTFYFNCCDNILLKRVETLSSKWNFSYKSINIIASKAKWGMCDNNKNLYFNFKLLMLPPDVIDYVIIHELCHTKELNHSKNFWQLVQRYMPDYKANQKLLKDSNFLIKLY